MMNDEWEVHFETSATHYKQCSYTHHLLHWHMAICGTGSGCLVIHFSLIDIQLIPPSIRYKQTNWSALHPLELSLRLSSDFCMFSSLFASLFECVSLTKHCRNIRTCLFTHNTYLHINPNLSVHIIVYWSTKQCSKHPKNNRPPPSPSSSLDRFSILDNQILFEFMFACMYRTTNTFSPISFFIVNATEFMQNSLERMFMSHIREDPVLWWSHHHA